MKKNNRGFTLVETLIVSTFVVGVLTYLFTQFVTLKNGYNRTFKYNTVESLYKALNIDRYLTGVEASKVVKEVNDSSFGYADISSCVKFDSSSYCGILMDSLDVKTVIVSKSNLEGLLAVLKNNNPYTEGLYQFVKRDKINVDKSYKLIVEYNDDTFASINLSI